MELRIETQKQTLAARDESIKKLMDMMQSKGYSSKIMEEERIEYERLRTRNIELETRLRHLENVLETKETDELTCIEINPILLRTHSLLFVSSVNSERYAI